MKKMRVILSFLIFGAFLWLSPAVGETATWNFSCGDTVTLQQFIDYSVSPGDTILVTGACSENLNIYKNVNLDGGGGAAISGTDSSRPTVNVNLGASWVTIKGFQISGGFDGIMVYGGSTALIDSNTISTGRNGIYVGVHSYVRIVNNWIVNNSWDGISVHDNSVAEIGFTYPNTVSGNTIKGNGGSGVVVDNSSVALIVGNQIQNNTESGVEVIQLSRADVSSNDISGNGSNGVFVTKGSGVNLGHDTGTGVLDLPNTTGSDLNAERGIMCSIGGYVDGRLGTLRGAHGVKGIRQGCINSLIK